MKTNLLVCALAVALLLISAGCYKPVSQPQPPSPTGCSSADSTWYQASVNGFDFNPGSPYYKQLIVNFKFIQSEITCPETSSSTDLIIKNLTNNTISFGYDIIFHLNYVTWNYQNAVTIPPLSSVDVGQINSNPARVDLGSINIQGSNITYY
jgi:hypothetical protein